MNDHDQAVLDASFGSMQCWDDPERPVTSYLPPGFVCSAYWYASRSGQITGRPAPDEGDLEFLRELGLRAARLARWEGIPAVTVPEGPFPAVYLWPERIWSEVADAMAQHAAEHGACGPYARPGSPHPMVHDVLALDRRYGHSGDPAWESADGDPEGYGDPQPGRAAYESQGRPRGDSFWSYPAPPEDSQAYGDWCQMADREMTGVPYRDEAVPWDGDDIRPY